jgi:hypothetical protein
VSGRPVLLDAVFIVAGLAMFAMRHGLAVRTGPAADAKID